MKIVMMQAELETTVPCDPHPWRAAIVLGVLAVIGGVVASMIVGPWFDPRHRAWLMPGDAWTSMRAAHYVAQGTYPLIYETGTKRDVFDSGPLLPLLLAPIAWIGDRFHLSEGYPYPVARPTLWPIYEPYALATAIPLTYAVRCLATQLHLLRQRLQLEVGVLLLAFVPMAIVYGHYEDVIALALLLMALRELFAGRAPTGALYLAVAIAFKQWTLLAVPVYVAACPPPMRFKAALRSVVPPALFMSAFIAIDYKYASRALLHPPAFPSLGHSALWISPSTDYVQSAPTRVFVFLIALFAGWMIRRNPTPTIVLGTLGCVLLSRLFFDPTVHAYYAAPGLVLLLFAATNRRDFAVTAALGAALLLAFPVHPNRWLWWTVVLGLCLALFVRQAHRSSAGSLERPASLTGQRTRPIRETL
jgi:hypothetical protein